MWNQKRPTRVVCGVKKEKAVTRQNTANLNPRTNSNTTNLPYPTHLLPQLSVPSFTDPMRSPGVEVGESSSF